MKILKKLFIGCAFLLFAVLFALMVWVFNSFSIYTNDIDKVVQQSREILGPDINELKKLAVVAEGHRGIKTWGARQAYYDLSYRHRSPSMGVWQFNGMLWYLLLPAYLNEDELFYLWCHYALYTDDWGLNHAAIKFYGKPILQLTLEQQASLMAMVRSPTWYKIGTEQSKKRIKQILELYNRAY